MSELNNHEFRSLKDIERFVNMLKTENEKTELTIKKLDRNLSKVVSADKPFTITGPDSNIKTVTVQLETPAPKTVAQIKKNFELMKELYSRYDALNVVEIKINTAFKDVNGREKVAQATEEAKKEVTKQLKQLKKIQSELTSKHLPTRLQQNTKFIFSDALSYLKGNFEGKFTRGVMNVITDSEKKQYIQYTTILHLTKVKTLKGETYNHLYITLTYVVGPDGNAMQFLDTSDRFEPPLEKPIQEYNRGISFTTKQQGAELLRHELHALNLSNLPEVPTVFPEDMDSKKELFRVGKEIKKIEVDDKTNSILFTMQGHLSEEEVDDAALSIDYTFKQIFKKSKLNYRMTWKSVGNKIVFHVLPGQTKSGKADALNQSILNLFVDNFNLQGKPEKVKQILRILRNE